MLRDLRHALRVLLRAKGWTCIVLASLALGIGANTALFSAVNGVLLQTVAVQDPDGLVRLSWFGDNDMVRSSSEYGYSGNLPGGERRRTTFSYPAYRELRAANETLSGLFAAAPYGRVNVVIDGEAEIASAFIASGSYFDVLGVTAAAGRLITAQDDEAGAPPVVVISHRYWQRRFGGDRDVIGKVLSVNGVAVTLVGVTSPGYKGVQGPERGAAEVHLPLVLDPELSGEDRLRQPTWWWLQVMGRLQAGRSAAQVESNLAGVFQAAAQQGMRTYLEGLSAEQRGLSHNQDRTAVPRLTVESGRRGIYEVNPRTQQDTRVLAGVVILVLLVVCANVANLLLSRAATRQREIATRLSLGATRARLVRQLVSESVLLATVGGGLGALLAFWARRLLPFGGDAPFDGRVLAFALLLSLLTGIVFSAVPALRATGIDLVASLKENSRGSRGSRGLLSRGLLVLQVSVSLVLLTAAGLFLATLRNLRAVDVGFDPSNILLFRVDPALSGYDEERMPLLYDQIRERLAGLGGVESVSLSRSTFLAGSTSMSMVYLQDGGEDESHRVHMMSVSPEFFATLRIPVLAGRTFDDRDVDSAPRVAAVNATAARVLLDSAEPLGQRFGFRHEERSEIEIVGLVGDVKYGTVRDAAPPTIFVPYRQRGVGPMTFEVRTQMEPQALMPTVRAAVREIDPKLPLMDVSTQAQQVENRLRQERYFALSYALFGGVATLLAALGLFGLASYSVATRTQEIGIRMALGARRGDVVGMVLKELLLLVGLGVLFGVVGTLAAGQLVRSLLFGVASTDVAPLAVSTVLLLLASAAAGYLPALRASRVDPMVALQDE
ncbi:MAG: ABC transporter permease [Acidobacteriota bacterium]